VLNYADMVKRPWLLIVKKPYYLHYAERETRVGELISRHGSEQAARSAHQMRELTDKLEVIHLSDCRCPDPRKFGTKLQCAICGKSKLEEPTNG
jgi:hypothetical protein